MSIGTFNGLWEESKANHRANAEARANEFRKDFEKTWSLFRRPFFYLILPLLAVPTFRRRFIVERETVRKEIKMIVVEYAPQIRTELKRFEDGFNQWEKENSGPSRCGSESASDKERSGRENAERLSTEMLDKISAISKYDWHFHPIDNPRKMVQNPYPGYLTCERAQNYCDHLIRVFG